MNHTLVGKNLAYGAKTGGGVSATPSELDAGAIGGFGFDTTDGVFKLVTAATLENFKDVTFYLGLGAGKVFQSVTHYLKGNCIASKHAYRAASNTVIVLSGFKTPADWDTDVYGFYGSRPTGFISIGEDVPNFLSYGNVYHADATRLPKNATVAEVRDAIYDQLVAQFALTGEATVAKANTDATSNITITFVNPQLKYYYVSADGYLQGLTVTTTYGDKGFGTALDVQPKENLDRIYRGNLYTMEAAPYSIYNIPAQYASGTNYSAIYLQTVNATDDKTGQKALTTTMVYTWLYAPAGATLTELNSIVDAINGVDVTP